MAKFYYTRTKKVVDIPDHLADAYERRRWYQRLPDPLDRPSTSARYVSTDVPDGTVTEIIEWVGEDPARRRAAITAERAGKQRKTLIAALSQD